MKNEKIRKRSEKKNLKNIFSKDQRKSVINGKKEMTMKEKCKNRAGLEGKPGLRAWSKCRAPALTRAGPQGLIHGRMSRRRVTLLRTDRWTDGPTKKWLIESRVHD